MAIPKKNAFSRRLPDLVTEELVAVLSQKNSYEFKELFEVVHLRLKERNAASGGEEMLRLRAYEKLQGLVNRGMVKKTMKKYKGLDSISKALPQPGQGYPTGPSPETAAAIARAAIAAAAMKQNETEVAAPTA